MTLKLVNEVKKLRNDVKALREEVETLNNRDEVMMAKVAEQVMINYLGEQIEFTMTDGVINDG